MYFMEKGAFTGEISPSMVQELCTSVILGHSERRHYFGETDEMINKKVLAALTHGLRPIVCVGENQEEHASNQTEQVIHTQIQKDLSSLPTEHVQEVVIAYEPVWAIGSGAPDTAQDAGNVCHRIRQYYGDLFGAERADAVRILYGGSVTSENVAEFVAQPDIDGVLVGSDSITSDFVPLVRRMGEAIYS
jgi:triosephosphate isomerase